MAGRNGSLVVRTLAERGSWGAAALGIPGVTRARALTLPVAPGLAELLPSGGIRRGATVGVEGSAFLALSLASAVSQDGGWCAAIGTRSLGVLCAAEMGFDLSRFVLAFAPRASEWVRATNALLEGCEVVLAWPPPSVGLKPAERLAAVARERNATLVVAGRGWPGRIDLMLSVSRAEWLGASGGTGRFRERRAEIVVSGRGAASIERRTTMWLPNARGEIAIVSPAVPIEGIAMQA